MSEYEPIEVVAPEGVTFIDGPVGPRASDGHEYAEYSFDRFDVPPDGLYAAKEKLAAYYQRWLNGFCLSRGVRTIEWRVKPDISVHAKPRSKKKLSYVRIRSRFHSPEASAKVDAERMIEAYKSTVASKAKATS